MTAGNRVRLKAAADSVVMHGVVRAAWIRRSNLARVDIDSRFRRASDDVAVDRGRGTGTSQVDPDAAANDVVVGDFGAGIALDRDVHADVIFGGQSERDDRKAVEGDVPPDDAGGS